MLLYKISQSPLWSNKYNKYCALVLANFKVLIYIIWIMRAMHCSFYFPGWKTVKKTDIHFPQGGNIEIHLKTQDSLKGLIINNPVWIYPSTNKTQIVHQLNATKLYRLYNYVHQFGSLLSIEIILIFYMTPSFASFA